FSRPHKTNKAAKWPLYSHHQKLYFTLIFILFSLIFSWTFPVFTDDISRYLARCGCAPTHPHR
ncbi:TPA: hypothetical protein ACG7OW_003240, partial [Escherichia coli]